MSNEIDLLMTKQANEKVQYLFSRVTKIGECWECHLSNVSEGYCKIYKGTEFAHRFVYETVKGPIPEGKIVRHTCDNRRCINPEHLIAGTHQDNAQDRQDRGRHVPGKGPEVGAMRALTVERHQELLSFHKQGWSQRALAQHFWISQYAVWCYINKYEVMYV